MYPLTGLIVLVRRWWEARTNARYERLMRAAESAGDYERLTDWEARGEQARERRHRRRMDWILAPLDIARGVAVVLATEIGLLLTLGAVLAIAHQDAGWLLTPVQKVVDAVAWAVWLVGVLWWPVLIAVPGLVVAGLWQTGPRHGSVPRWAAPGGAEQHLGVVVTPGRVATALAHLGIPALNRAVKDGWQVEFATPPVRVNGRGYQATFQPADGRDPGDDRRQARRVGPQPRPRPAGSLARRRGPRRIRGSVGGRPGIDRTASAALSAAARRDGRRVRRGAARAVTARGGDRPAAARSQRGVRRGDGQGKSNAARVGAALDPIAELWVFVFANNGDFDAYRPRLTRYHRGVDEQTTQAAVEALHALYAEVGRREARLAQLGAKKVTRPLAERYPDLRPLAALFSECHELFGDPNHGREAADLAVQTMRRARKTAITLLFDTQSSRADAIPPKIVELVKLNACFAVKSWRSNDGFLGDGSFQAGIRATELRMGKDVGTSILTGATAERFEIVKWFYIEADDDTGFDAAADIIARAMAGRHPAVTGPAPGRGEQARDVGRDLLDDLAAVLGADQPGAPKVPAADLPARLRVLAPDWTPYRSITGVDIRRYLAAEHGVMVPTSKRRYPVEPAAIRDAITRRDIRCDTGRDTDWPGG
jgi:S-DNA-T family DNA segregation ATPase FtsK/SpoIIIE